MKQLFLTFLISTLCLSFNLFAQNTHDLEFNDSITVRLNFPFKSSVKKFKIERSNFVKNTGFEIKPIGISLKPTIQCYLLASDKGYLNLLYSNEELFKLNSEGEMTIIERNIDQDTDENKRHVIIYKELRKDNQVYNVYFVLYGRKKLVDEYYDLILKSHREFTEFALNE